MRQGLSGILMGILMDILIKQASLAVKNSRSVNLFHKPFHGGTGQRPVPSFRSLRICGDIAVIIHACYVMPFYSKKGGLRVAIFSRTKTVPLFLPFSLK